MALGSLSINSTAFGFGERIPDRFTQFGEDVSPPLTWSGLPAQTAELCVMCHDPDAPKVHGFTHWVAYGIGPEVARVGFGDDLIGVSGKNDYGTVGYRGPRPPAGHGVHSYYFFLFALSKRLDLETGLSRVELLPYVAETTLEVARHVGSYSQPG